MTANLDAFAFRPNVGGGFPPLFPAESRSCIVSMDCALFCGLYIKVYSEAIMYFTSRDMMGGAASDRLGLLQWLWNFEEGARGSMRKFSRE